MYAQCLVLIISFDDLLCWQELADMIKSDKIPSQDYLVVDVRDDDYHGGNIKGSLNLPSREFLMNVDGLVKKTKDVPIVIFHCSLSQVR